MTPWVGGIDTGTEATCTGSQRPCVTLIDVALRACEMPKSEFLRKFENRVSVVGRDGTVNKVGEPAPVAVDNSGVITPGNLHPALADALLGGVSTSNGGGSVMGSFGDPLGSPSRASRDFGGAVASTGQVTISAPPQPSAGRRTVKTKPTASELQVLPSIADS